MERMCLRGVHEKRKEWSAAKDGNMVILPLEYDDIIITEID